MELVCIDDSERLTVSQNSKANLPEHDFHFQISLEAFDHVQFREGHLHVKDKWMKILTNDLSKKFINAVGCHSVLMDSEHADSNSTVLNRYQMSLCFHALYREHCGHCDSFWVSYCDATAQVIIYSLSVNNHKKFDLSYMFSLLQHIYQWVIGWVPQVVSIRHWQFLRAPPYAVCPSTCLETKAETVNSVCGPVPLLQEYSAVKCSKSLLRAKRLHAYNAYCFSPMSNEIDKLKEFGSGSFELRPDIIKSTYRKDTRMKLLINAAKINANSAESSRKHKFFYMLAESKIRQLLLQPHATEVSYAYIEKLIVDRLSQKSVDFSSGMDSVADLIDLLDAVLRRTGPGWVVVVARRLAKFVILPFFRAIEVVGAPVEDSLEAMARFMSAHPVVVKCEHNSITNEILRILRTRSNITCGSLGCVEALLSGGELGHVRMFTLCSLLLGRFVAVSTSTEATLIVRILLLFPPELVCSDPQLYNTVIGLCGNATAMFSDDIELRRVSNELITEFVKHDHRISRNSTINQEVPTMAAVELDLQAPKMEDEVVCSIVSTSTQKVAETADGSVQAAGGTVYHDDSSPRSSCPSLE